MPNPSTGGYFPHELFYHGHADFIPLPGTNAGTANGVNSGSDPAAKSFCIELRIAGGNAPSIERISIR
jgi:hypothetical protein